MNNKNHRSICTETLVNCFTAPEKFARKSRPLNQPALRRTVLATALSASLSLSAAGDVHATEITSNISGPYAFSSGSLLIDPGVTVTGTSSNNYAIVNTGSSATTFTNAGVVTGAQRAFQMLSGTLSSVTNSGTLYGTGHGIELVTSTISGTLENSGTISGNGAFGDSSGIRLTGSFGQLTSVGQILNDASGTISGQAYGLNFQAYSSATGVTNNGVISSNGTALYNAGTIGALNNSGRISGANYAIANVGSLGNITNSGSIAGTISNTSSTALTIIGGSGSTFGTLTGYSGIGLITNTASNLIFSSGNTLLNDNINVGSNTVSNVASTLQVNNHLTVTGNYSQNSGASLIFGVADNAVANGSTSDTGYGRLTVTGNTTLAAGSTVGLTKLNSYAFAAGQRYVLIATSGTAAYNAAALNYSISGYSGSVTGASVADGANTDLVVTLNSATNGNAPNNNATTNVAVSSLNGLFKYSGTNAPLLEVFNSAAALGSTAEANKAGAQLSPTAVNGGLVQASASAAQTVANLTYAHIDGLRNGSNGSNGSTGSGTSGVATGERAYDVGLWGQVFGGHTAQSARQNVSGYGANYGGLLLAGDALVDDQLRAGAMFSYGRTSLSGADDNTGSSASVNNYGVHGYAGYSGDPWYVNVMAGVTRQQYSTTRNVNYTGFSGVANGSFNGLQYSSSVQAGYPLNVEQWLPGVTLTPLAGLSYSVVRQNGYTESGGNGAALVVDAASTSSLKSELAMRLESSVDSAYGKLMPLAQLGWRHEYHDSRLQSSASFAADTTGTSSFVTQSATPIRNTGTLVLGLTLLQSKNLKIATRYTLEAGSGYTDQAASLQLRWQY